MTDKTGERTRYGEVGEKNQGGRRQKAGAMKTEKAS